MDTTRRNILAGLAFALPAATATATACAEEVAPFDLQNWLDTADRNAVLRYHAARLAEVMGEIDTAREYQIRLSHEHGWLTVVGWPKDASTVRREACDVAGAV